MCIALSYCCVVWVLDMFISKQNHCTAHCTRQLASCQANCPTRPALLFPISRSIRWYISNKNGNCSSDCECDGFISWPSHYTCPGFTWMNLEPNLPTPVIPATSNSIQPPRHLVQEGPMGAWVPWGIETEAAHITKRHSQIISQINKKQSLGWGEMLFEHVVNVSLPDHQ